MPVQRFEVVAQRRIELPESTQPLADLTEEVGHGSVAFVQPGMDVGSAADEFLTVRVPTGLALERFVLPG